MIVRTIYGRFILDCSAFNSLTPSAVLRHTPQRCIGGSSPQHCNALQYIALHYNVAQAVIHAVKDEGVL